MSRIKDFSLPIVEKRPPIKCCDTCAHQLPHWDGKGYCRRAMFSCELQRRHPDWACDQNFSGWVERPPPAPRRSLLQWLYDTFLRMESL